MMLDESTRDDVQKAIDDFSGEMPESDTGAVMDNRKLNDLIKNAMIGKDKDSK